MIIHHDENNNQNNENNNQNNENNQNLIINNENNEREGLPDIKKIKIKRMIIKIKKIKKKMDMEKNIIQIIMIFLGMKKKTK